MRLLTYNIHKGIGGGDRRYRLSRVIDVIEQQHPDCVCLQEVTFDLPRTRYHDQSHVLANHFAPMHSFFQPNVKWKRGGYGNLVLSRWPIQIEHRVSLQFQNRKPRGAQVVVLETPRGHLRLVNWHLGLSEEERQWQVTHLLKHPSFRELHHLPTLIAGDFNDWRNTLGAQSLAEHGLAQATSPPSRFRSFPAMLSVMSLDKAFHCPEVVVHSAKVIRTALARQASDHLPLVLDFDLSHHREHHAKESSPHVTQH